MNSNPALGLIGFWMMLQLAATIAILLGGIYALYCLGRASAGLDRMASAMEDWVSQQRAGSTAATPGSASITPLSHRIEPAPANTQSSPSAVMSPELSTPPGVQAQPFSPATPLSTADTSPVSSSSAGSSTNPTSHESTP